MSPPTMNGKICLITGGTNGIGKVTAVELARHGASVRIIGRSKLRCQETVDAIRKQTGNPDVDFLTADLSSQMEVRRVAKEFLERHQSLHLLINNAGAMFARRQVSTDGIEMTLALNHMAYFLLTNLLLDIMKRSAPARIINVSSRAHEDVSAFDFQDPQVETGKSGRHYGTTELGSLFYTLVKPWAHPGFMQYCQSKLANLLFTFELARKLKGTGVTANALHPGFVSTGFSVGNGSYGAFMRLWAKLFGISAVQGAQTTIYLATAPEMEAVTGKYFAKQKEVKPSAAALNQEGAQKLWELSTQWAERSVL